MEPAHKKSKIDEIINFAGEMSCNDIEDLRERLQCIEDNKKEIRFKYIVHVQNFERDKALEMVNINPWLLNEVFGYIDYNKLIKEPLISDENQKHSTYTWLMWELYGKRKNENIGIKTYLINFLKKELIQTFGQWTAMNI